MLRDIGASMGEILTNRLCLDCRKLYRKDYSIQGDYNEDGRLMSYCPKCGDMHPPLAVQINIAEYSKRKKHKLGVRIAYFFDIAYKEMAEVNKSIIHLQNDNYIDTFMKQVSKNFGVTLKREDVLKCLEGSGNIKR